MFYCHKEDGDLFVKMSSTQTAAPKYDPVDRTRGTAMVYNII
jgi:hypothetical protein